MSEDAKQVVFGVERDSALPACDGGTPTRKTWITPKVITATSEETATGVGTHVDGTAGDS